MGNDTKLMFTGNAGDFYKKITIVLGLLLLIGISYAPSSYAATDFSIDRVRINGDAVAESSTTLIPEADIFLAVVDFTTILVLEKGHVEAILKGRQSGIVVSDSTSTFDLNKNQSALVVLTLALRDNLRRESTFDLTIKVADARGDSEQKTFTIQTKRALSGRKLDVSIDNVEANGKHLAPDETNFIVIQGTKNDFDVHVGLTALQTVDHGRIEAILQYPNGDVAADQTATFAMSNDAAIVKTLTIPFNSRFEQNTFSLTVKVIDAEGNTEEKRYGVTISRTKFPFVISSMSLNPESNVQAGNFLDVTVRFKNSGIVPLEGITAKVSIPDLGVSATKIVGQLQTIDENSVISEDFLLKIPDSTSTGTYPLRSEIASQFGGDSEVKELPVYIIGKEDQPQRTQAKEQLDITVPLASQFIYDTTKEVIYPVTLTNKGSTAKAYTVGIDTIDFGDYRISPTNTLVLEPSQSKTVNIVIKPHDNIQSGQETFSVVVTSGNKDAGDVFLKAVIVKSSAYNLRNIFEWFVVLTVLIATAVTLLYAVKAYVEKKNGKKEEIVKKESAKEEISVDESYY